MNISNKQYWWAHIKLPGIPVHFKALEYKNWWPRLWIKNTKCAVFYKSIASHFYLNTWAERRPPQRWACTAPHLGRTGPWRAGQRAARSQTRLWGTLDAGSSPGRCRRTAAWRRSSRDTAGRRAAASSSCAWSSETSPPVDSWSSLQLGHLRGEAKHDTWLINARMPDMKP